MGWDGQHDLSAGRYGPGRWCTRTTRPLGSAGDSDASRSTPGRRLGDAKGETRAPSRIPIGRPVRASEFPGLADELAALTVSADPEQRIHGRPEPEPAGDLP